MSKIENHFQLGSHHIKLANLNNAQLKMTTSYSLSKRLLINSLNFINCSIPYILGTLLAWPDTSNPKYYELALKGYILRSISFFWLAISLLLLIKIVQKSPTKSFINLLLTLILGSSTLLALWKCKNSYSQVNYLFELCLIFFALIPITQLQKANKRPIGFFIFCSLSNFTTALLSLTVHHGELHLGTLILGIFSLNFAQVNYGITIAFAPVIISIIAALIATSSSLAKVMYDSLTNLSANQSISKPRWYSDVIMCYLILVPMFVGLLAIGGMLPYQFSLAHLLLVPIVLLQINHRNSRIPKNSFAPKAITTASLITLVLILIGLIG